MNKQNLQFYSDNVESLLEQYDTVAFESVHQDWLEHLPKAGRVLDVGAGSGRDARYMAHGGLEVVAVEPCQKLSVKASKSDSGANIRWLADSLPLLQKTYDMNSPFDLILLSAVWMHLTYDERTVSMGRLAGLLSDNGILVITLRYGDFSDGRIAYPVDADEVVKLSKASGLSVAMKTDLNTDQLGRHDVAWQTIVLMK